MSRSSRPREEDSDPKSVDPTQTNVTWGSARAISRKVSTPLRGWICPTVSTTYSSAPTSSSTRARSRLPAVRSKASAQIPFGITLIGVLIPQATSSAFAASLTAMTWSA